MELSSPNVVKGGQFHVRTLYTVQSSHGKNVSNFISKFAYFLPRYIFSIRKKLYIMYFKFGCKYDLQIKIVAI